MPYSFTKIERDKSAIISYIFTFLIIFYFIVFWTLIWAVRLSVVFIVYYYSNFEQAIFKTMFNVVNLKDSLFILLFSIIVAYIHWGMVEKNLVNRILKILKAKINSNYEHTHNKQFHNILEELSIATGGYKFEGYIVPSMAINAFSICDFEGRNVIGVTEGLLRKLNRSQIEAIVAYEAARILKGDSIVTTLTESLFNISQEILDDMKYGFVDVDNMLVARQLAPGFFVFYILYINAVFSKVVGKLLNMFISRHRVLRADAIAVRLTRDPMSLAEGLYLASRCWHGEGMPGQGLNALFFVRPTFSKFSDKEGVFSELFYTHPPVDKRLSILLDIAHSDSNSMVEALMGGAKFTKDKFSKGNEASDKKWVLRRKGEWKGPFNLDEIKTLDWIRPDTLVKQLGTLTILSACEDKECGKVIESLKVKSTNSDIDCPKCYLHLEPVKYEGVDILKCRSCFGILVKPDNVKNIFDIREETFSQDIADMAKLVSEEKRLVWEIKRDHLHSNYQMACPSCQRFDKKMERNFYSNEYHVEIDKCPICNYIWFDKDELEILQFLFEEDNPQK